jgi:DNA-binding response OmpR family regulator
MSRILVVDDEPDIARSLKVGLERKGFTVEAFTNPIEALANYKSSWYDLLIIDVRMPYMNGIELVRKIRDRDSNVVVWFLTAFEILRIEFERMFPDIRANALIRKPISINELAHEISNELEKIEQVAV